jgi:hypothetical protein
MIIKNRPDWWRLASKTVPHLKRFGAQNGVYFDESAAIGCLNPAADRDLHKLLCDFLRELPHNQLEKTFPFDDLCDLCSEHDRVFQTEMEPG